MVTVSGKINHAVLGTFCPRALNVAVEASPGAQVVESLLLDELQDLRGDLLAKLSNEGSQKQTHVEGCIIYRDCVKEHGWCND